MTVKEQIRRAWRWDVRGRPAMVRRVRKLPAALRVRSIERQRELWGETYIGQIKRYAYAMPFSAAWAPLLESAQALSRLYLEVRHEPD